MWYLSLLFAIYVGLLIRALHKCKLRTPPDHQFSPPPCCSTLFGSIVCSKFDTYIVFKVASNEICPSRDCEGHC